MTGKDADIADAARRHGLSEGAARAIFNALQSGGGRQAQFSHPDLGGMGQWSGGMVQIGDMFNDVLKAKVSAFCREMSAEVGTAGWSTKETQPQTAVSPWAVRSPEPWWPAALGQPSSSGSQNGMGYACFPDKRRLAISRGGRVTLYDTGEHRLNAFSQQQPGTGDLSFSGQDGPVRLDSLKTVES